MRDSCKQLHEARDRQGQTLYRLCLYWQCAERRVVVIQGQSKPNSTELPTRFYEELARRSTLLDADDSPLATPDDITRIAMDLAERLGEAEKRADAAERDVADLLAE